MMIKDVMTGGVECVGPDDTLQAAACKMKSLGVGPLPVSDNDRVTGILTDRDIVIRAVAEGKDPKTTKVREAMSPDVVYCFEDEDSDRAAKLMQEHQIRRVLVMSHDKRLVGIVSLGDLATEGKKKTAGAVLQGVSEPSEPRR